MLDTSFVFLINHICDWQGPALTCHKSEFLFPFHSERTLSKKTKLLLRSGKKRAKRAGNSDLFISGVQNKEPIIWEFSARASI